MIRAGALHVVRVAVEYHMCQGCADTRVLGLGELLLDRLNHTRMGAGSIPHNYKYVANSSPSQRSAVSRIDTPDNRCFGDH